MNAINEIGNIYGYLTVITRDGKTSDGHAQWLCRCKCGNEISVSGKYLRTGKTLSCGCYHKEKVINSNCNRVDNLINKKFGKLLVLSEAGFITKNSGQQSRTYNCLCDCGNLCVKEHVYLANGDTISCGCLYSKGEQQIEELLIKNNVSYQREYSFFDLIDRYKLRFDFALFKDNQLSCLIEFQGIQHFDSTNNYYNEKLILHDQMKEDYCLRNNIPLYIIRYDEDLKIRLERIFNDTNI